MSNPDNLDMNSIMEQAKQMQEQMLAVQEEQSKQLVTGSAGGGKVTITVSGTGDFKNIVIAPDVVDPSDVPLLEELVLAAVRDAANQVGDLQDASIDALGIPDVDNVNKMLDNS